VHCISVKKEMFRISLMTYFMHCFSSFCCVYNNVEKKKITCDKFASGLAKAVMIFRFYGFLWDVHAILH
jgi:hypothetical protein